jgi:SAM-dependent methyltransferase
LDGVAIDFSSVAIKHLREKDEYKELRQTRGEHTCVAHVCDVTSDPLPAELDDGCDLVLVLFCLSAISPQHMQTVISKLTKCLRPGGLLMFRDYGRYDEAQLRFSKGHRLGEHFYVKGDGTRVYYFTTEDVQTLMRGGVLVHHSDNEASSDDGSSGGGRGDLLEQVELEYIRRQYANRGQQKARFRVWVHSKFRRTNVPYYDPPR